jgi:hypothetical protein
MFLEVISWKAFMVNIQVIKLNMATPEIYHILPRYNAGKEHASGEDVSKDKVVLPGPRVRLSGSGHEVGGQG